MPAGRQVIIETLRKQGANMDWYDRCQRVPVGEPEFAGGSRCGRLTQYYLEGDYAYTVNHDGSKYLEFKKARHPITNPAWYCSACTQRFNSWQDAMEHLAHE